MTDATKILIAALVASADGVYPVVIMPQGASFTLADTVEAIETVLDVVGSHCPPHAARSIREAAYGALWAGQGLTDDQIAAHAEIARRQRLARQRGACGE